MAVNLRPALAAVGPLVADIRADTGLPNVALGLLTTLPLLAFGVISTLTPLVTRRIGIEKAVAVALTLIAVGTLARTATSVSLLFLGTVVLGIGIAFGNVLLPALAKRDFPDRTGPMTSLYSSVMGLGATIAAGVSAPLALEVGWRGSLGVWALPAVLALLAWIPQVYGRSSVWGLRGRGSAFRSLGRSSLAWQVALFMGLQSLTFYVVLAWLPDLMQDRGMTPAAAGWMLALSQATGILGTALIPVVAGRMDDQRRIVASLGILELVALAGLLTPDVHLESLWVGLIGFVLGGTFGLALLLLVLRAADAETAGELSGMAQSIGYMIAATGPAVFGWIHDLTGGWAAPLLFLGVVLAGKVAVGIEAGRPGMVGPAANKQEVGLDKSRRCFVLGHDPAVGGRVHIRRPAIMPSIQRPLSGDVLVFDLTEERQIAGDDSTLARSGRSARTLLKSGPLRVTMVVLGPGGELAEHRAVGPITIHAIEGRLSFIAGEREHEVGPNELLSAGPGVPHRVRSEKGATFLLTVAQEKGRGPHPDG